MSDVPRQQRQMEVFALECWRCQRAIVLPASARPYHCCHCGALLVIEWRSVRSPLCAARKEPRRFPPETGLNGLDKYRS